MKAKIAVLVLTGVLLMACNPQRKKITPEEEKALFDRWAPWS